MCWAWSLRIAGSYPSVNAARKYLPSHLFTYYSGKSERLEALFREHQERFIDNLSDYEEEADSDSPLRRLFYCRHPHSKLVLFAGRHPAITDRFMRRLERCLVAVLDERELGRCCRKAHSSRGTPISYPGQAGRQLAAGIRRPRPGSTDYRFVRRVTKSSSRAVPD